MSEQFTPHNPLPQGAIEIIASTGGDDAIESFEEHRPDVVVYPETTAEVSAVLAYANDTGVPVVIGQPNSPQAQAFRKVAEEVARQVSIEAMKPELVVLRKSQ